MGECIGGIVSATSIPPCILPMHFWMHFFTFPSISGGFLAHWGDRCACGELKVYKALTAHPPKRWKTVEKNNTADKKRQTNAIVWGARGGRCFAPFPCKRQVTTKTLVSAVWRVRGGRRFPHSPVSAKWQPKPSCLQAPSDNQNLVCSSVCTYIHIYGGQAFSSFPCKRQVTTKTLVSAGTK